jgi:protein kinase
VKLSHPNIVKLIGVIKSKCEVYLVFEYMEKNLYQLLKDNRLDIVQIRNIMFQALQGMHFMHSKGMFHRDLKPENILEHNGVVKIADFGLARNFTDEPPFTDYVSTRWYRAPEILLGSKQYDKSVDMFALGCIFAELVMRFPLFPGKNEADQLNKILKMLGTPSQKTSPTIFHLAKKANISLPNFERQSLSSIINCRDLSAVSLIEKMIQINPENRISASDALGHDFFHTSISRSPKPDLSKNRRPCLRQSIDFKSDTMIPEPFSLNITQIQPSHRSAKRSPDRATEIPKKEDYLQRTQFQPGANLFDLLKLNKP